MHISRLQIQDLRCLADVRMDPAPGLNQLVGPNGSGKSSVLEAIHLLSHGRSFRSGPVDSLIRRTGTCLQIYAEVQVRDGPADRLGLGRPGGRWEVHVDGISNRTLAELVARCAVICFEPGSHALIAGAAEERRRFLDWGVFHVEHAFLAHWRRYQRALRQRNAVLRHLPHTASDAELAPWETAMQEHGAWIDRVRLSYLQQLTPHLREHLHALLPELGEPRIDYRRGWSGDQTLDSVLALRRERDRQRGHSTLGPHRADWSLVFEHAPQREHLSRGQEKLAALGCLLAQGSVYSAQHGQWPIVCLDDLASELDEPHQQRLLEVLASVNTQVWITATSPLQGLPSTAAMFHVEQGNISRN